MTHQQLAKTQGYQLRWHFTQKTIQQSITWDQRHWEALADGSWLQESQPAEDLRPQEPPPWKPLLKRWQGFLRQMAVTDFQLNYSLQKIFLFQPRPRALQHQQEWTFSWTLPTRGLGPLLGSMCFRQALPPSEFMTEYISLLTKVPVLETSQAPEVPVFFDGRLLVHFLSHAVHHLTQSTKGLGTWEHHPKDATPLSQDAESYLANSESNLPNPLLPRWVVFYPQNRTAKPEKVWTALHYDNDEDLLVCYRRCKGDLQFRKFRLPEPLYRLFPQLSFMGNQRHLVVRRCQTTLPDAVWSTKSC